jgi:hypothetical protein
MLKQIAIPFVLVATMAVSSPAAQSDPQATQTKPVETAQTKPETVKTEPRAPQPPPQLANVRLELTIADQRGTATPVNKTVTLVLADRLSGRIRTSGDVRTPQGYRSVTLNVDATPTLLRDGRVQVNVTLEFRPTVSEGSTVEDTPTSISEYVNVILEDGKPLIVSQSADPHTDRKVRVELKATILK